jgi:hypothetical protein
MAKLKATFRGINTDLYGNATPDGSCLDTLNTVIDGNSTLSGRIGFDVWDNNTGNKGNILNMFVCEFANRVTYLVTKRTDGKLYHWQVYPTAASSWTEIDNLYDEHSVTERGFFYFWANRLYYFDSVGGTKWDGTNVYRAGIESSVSPAMGDAPGGAMEGYYHLTSAKVNTRTGEESSFTEVQSAGVTTRASAGKGGLALSNWSGASAGIIDNTNDLEFEWDAVRFYRTMGNTELLGFASGGSGVEMFSYLLYEEDLIFKTEASPTIYRSDEAVARSRQPTNRGGVPPGAKFGCFNGSQAIYLHVFPKSRDNILLKDGRTEFPELMMYSVPGYPASVPQVQEYNLAGKPDRKYFLPRPWTGVVPNGVAGAITGCASLGSRFFIFTATQTYQARPSGTGRMRPILLDPAHGALGVNAVVQTPRSVHALGKESWLRITGNGFSNVARFRFEDVIDTITDPTGGADMPTVGGYYAHRDEVWFAVAKSGGTAGKAQRVMLYDDAKQELVSIFDPTNLSTAGITAMCELTTPVQTPIMLVALDDGRILSWPGSQYQDAVTGGDDLSYACSWQGLYGQKNRAYHNQLAYLDVHMADVPAAGITLGVSGHRSASRVGNDALVTKTIPVTKQNLTDSIGAEFDPRTDGNIFEIKFSSTTEQGAQWKVGDMILDIDRISP